MVAEGIIKEQVKSKVKELSSWENVQYEGGRIFYETQTILNEIHLYNTSNKIFYLEQLLNSKFTIQDNWPGKAPDVTSQFKNWLIQTIAKLKIEQIQSKISVNNIIDINKLLLDTKLKEILEDRIKELERGFLSESPLSILFLTGSTLEGLLFGYAKKHPKNFNSSKAAPKKNGKTLAFNEWTLESFINASKEIGLIEDDVKKFSQIIQGYRNYIHPYEQLKNDFKPTLQTAKLCVETLITIIEQLNANQENLEIDS